MSIIILFGTLFYQILYEITMQTCMHFAKLISLKRCPCLNTRANNLRDFICKFITKVKRLFRPAAKAALSRIIAIFCAVMHTA